MGSINHLGHLAVESMIMENTFKEQKVHVQTIFKETHNFSSEPLNNVFNGEKHIRLR